MESYCEGYLTTHCKSCEYWLDGSTWDLGCGYPFDDCQYLRPIPVEEPPEPKKKRYSYDGPVMMFDRYVNDCWHGETIAVSERKARSNLTFQWKNEHGYTPNTNVTLPGQIVMMD